MGIPLHEALEQTEHMRAGGPGPITQDGEDAPRERVPTEAELARQNEKAMAQLNALMSGL